MLLTWRLTLLGVLLAALVLYFFGSSTAEAPATGTLPLARDSSPADTLQRLQALLRPDSWSGSEQADRPLSVSRVSPFGEGPVVEDDEDADEQPSPQQEQKAALWEAVSSLYCARWPGAAEADRPTDAMATPDALQEVTAPCRSSPRPKPQEALALVKAAAAAGDRDAVLAWSHQALEARIERRELGDTTRDPDEPFVVEQLERLARSGDVNAMEAASLLLGAGGDDKDVLGSLVYGMVAQLRRDGAPLRLTNEMLEGFPDEERHELLRRTDQLVSACCKNMPAQPDAARN